jgi:hypothetical protein
MDGNPTVRQRGDQRGREDLHAAEGIPEAGA